VQLPVVMASEEIVRTEEQQYPYCDDLLSSLLQRHWKNGSVMGGGWIGG
jgi:hypothetical protein